MLWVEQRATDGGTLLKRVDYGYDVFGNRISQTVTISGVATTTRYAFDGSRLWAQLDGNGNLTTRYLLGDGVSTVFARTDSSGVSWLLQDRLGSVREVLNASGSIAAVIAYDSSGNQTSNSNPTAAGNILWQGMYLFTATGLYGTPNRDLDTTTERWYQTDPAEADVNTYRGMGNDGTNAVDPSGLDTSGALGAMTARLRDFEQQYPGLMSAIPAPPSLDEPTPYLGEWVINCQNGTRTRLGDPKRYRQNGLGNWEVMTPGYGSDISDDIKAIRKALNEFVVEPAENTYYLGEYFILGWDSEYKPRVAYVEQFNRGEIEWHEAVLHGTGDAAGTLLLVNPAGKAGNARKLEGFEAKVAETGWNKSNVAALKPNLNKNGAKSTFGIYEIRIDGKLYKIGKADMERVTQSSGLPTRLHQQVRKMREKLGEDIAVEGKVVEKLGTTTTAKAKAAENARLQRNFDKTGEVPKGNEKSFTPQ
jgi:RHS repeat-associated protein